MSEGFKHRFVIEVEGDNSGFRGELIEGPIHLEGRPVSEKMAVNYALIHIAASHVFEFRDPSDPDFELNNNIARRFHEMTEGIHKLLIEDLESYGIMDCPCVNEGPTSFIEFKLSSNPGGHMN